MNRTYDKNNSTAPRGVEDGYVLKRLEKKIGIRARHVGTYGVGYVTLGIWGGGNFHRPGVFHDSIVSLHFD